MEKEIMPKERTEKNEFMTLRGYYEKLPDATFPKADFIRKITQACGCTEACVRSWLRGASKPSKARIKKLSDITGIPEENLWAD